jgi:hypothetical protein
VAKGRIPRLNLNGESFDLHLERLHLTVLPARPGTAESRHGASSTPRSPGSPSTYTPEYPEEGIPLTELNRRYGIGVGEADPLHERFAAAGLEYNRPEVLPNTRLAVRLTELARDLGPHEPFHDRLMDAYWSETTKYRRRGRAPAAGSRSRIGR